MLRGLHLLGLNGKGTLKIKERLIEAHTGTSREERDEKTLEFSPGLI